MPTRQAAEPTTKAAKRLPFDHLSLLLDGWQQDLEAKNRSTATISSYLRCTRRMIEFFGDKGMPATASGTAREHVAAFIAHMIQTVSPVTGAKHYRSVQQFFRFLVEDGEIAHSPMEKMKPPKVEDKPVPVVENDDMEKLFATCKGATFENRRDTALLSFMIESGCRVGEIVGMTLDDYDVQRRLVSVTGKGNRTRGIGASNELIADLRRYLRLRGAHPFADQTDAFWIGRKGQLTVSGVAQLLERRCDEAGIAHIHPHQFRHTFAHNWQVAGGNETDLMNAAGWRSRDMLARYGRSAAEGRAQDAQRAFSTIAKLKRR